MSSSCVIHVVDFDGIWCDDDWKLRLGLNSENAAGSHTYTFLPLMIWYNYLGPCERAKRKKEIII